jgi:hypothetical protein
MRLVGDLGAALGQQIANVMKSIVTLACSTITRACGANRLRWTQVRTSSGSPAKPASTHVNAYAKLRCLSCSVTLRLVTSCTRRWTVNLCFSELGLTNE